MTGTLYELGCLRALDDLLEPGVLDWDIYVGVSGGAFVASLLARFRRERGRFARLLGRHGIRLQDPARLPDVPASLPYRSDVARRLAASLDRLGSRLDGAGRVSR